MPKYPDLIERLLLNPDLLRKLTPSEPLTWTWLTKAREADAAQLGGGLAVADERMLAMVKGALLCAVDDLDGAHRIFQDEPGDMGSYWHGVMHRREGDFDNARYWFRRAGRLSIFPRLHELAREHSATMARQPSWDAYLFVGQCEQARHGATELVAECLHLQRAEFDGLLAHCWGKAFGVAD